jgi:S1-C subfamily serine protease
MAKTVRIVSAVLLLMVLSVLSGALIASGFVNSSLETQSRIPPTNTSVERPLVEVPPRDTDSDNSVMQPGGVLDARSAVRTAGPAVVTIINTINSGNTRVFPGMAPSASGSGVIISEDGYIVTNQHVIEDQRSLEVIFSDGTKAPAKLVGADAFSDLAVVKVEVDVPAVAQFANSDDLEPGQPVVAIGSALGDFRNTVTVGVISAVNRDLGDPDSPALRNLIQTDAAINNGNSGGPLLSLDGRVVGINVAVVRGGNTTGAVAEGLGFAIPSNTAQRVVDQLISQGSVTRPYIGISFQTINPQIAALYELERQQGVLVREVVADSPAAKAGLVQNSIITHFDGTELNEDNALLELLMKHKVGDTVKMTVLFPNEQTEREVTITLASRPQDR